LCYVGVSVSIIQIQNFVCLKITFPQAVRRFRAQALQETKREQNEVNPNG